MKKLLEKIGSAPGTLLYTGIHETSETHWHLYTFSLETLQTQSGKSRFEMPLAPDQKQWLLVTGLAEPSFIAALGEPLQLHPMVQEDILHVHQRPKAERYDEGLFITLPRLHLKAGFLEREQISFWLYQNTLVTFCEHEDHPFEKIITALNRPTSRIRNNNIEYLLYRLLDHLIDQYFLVGHHLEEQLETLSENMGEPQDQDQLTQLHQIKSQLLLMTKHTSPLIELQAVLKKEDLTDQNLVYWQDLKDHIMQIQESVKSLSDQTDSLFNLYFSLLSLRTNRIMQSLTVITLIFLPLTLITGIYGMNFVSMPLLNSPWGFWLIIASMWLIGIAILTYAHRKDWF